MALDTPYLEKREIPTVSEFDVIARFRETISTVKSVSSSENWNFLGSYRLGGVVVNASPCFGCMII